jgi:putative MATE family efflux protein
MASSIPLSIGKKALKSFMYSHLSIFTEFPLRREELFFPLRLTLPIVFSNLLYAIQSYVSLFLVSPLGEKAIAGVGFASTLLWFIYSVIEAVYVGVNVLVAQSTGKGEKSGRFVLTGILISLFLSVSLIFFFEDFFRFFLRLLSVPAEVTGVVLGYLKPVIYLLPFMFATNVVNAGFTGSGKTKIVFAVTFFVTILNLVLSVLLIYGIWIFPRLEVTGAGLAVGISESLGFLFYLPFLMKEKVLNPFRDLNLSLKETWTLIKLGFPAGIEEILMALSFNVFSGIVASCGALALAAFQIGLRVEFFSVALGIAFFYASTTVIGQKFGEKDWKGLKASFKVLLISATGLAGILGILMGVSGRYVAGLFTENPDVIYWSSIYLLAAALSQPLMAFQFVIFGTLRGMGKTYLPLVINSISFWLFRIFPSVVLLKFIKTPYVPWTMMVIENGIRALWGYTKIRKTIPF